MRAETFTRKCDRHHGLSDFAQSAERAFDGDHNSANYNMKSAPRGMRRFEVKI
jgi:hypothetical protein